MVNTEKKRQSAFSDEVLSAINGFDEKPNTAKSPDRSTIESVSKQVNFTSREPSKVKREGRYYRTGRMVHFSTKTTQDYNDKFYKLVDERGLKIAEVFEMAVDALIEKLEKAQ